jgi:hypothetical protein
VAAGGQVCAIRGALEDSGRALWQRRLCDLFTLFSRYAKRLSSCLIKVKVACLRTWLNS